MKYTIQMTLKQLCIQSRKWQQMYMFTWEGKLNFFFLSGLMVYSHHDTPRLQKTCEPKGKEEVW